LRESHPPHRRLATLALAYAAFALLATPAALWAAGDSPTETTPTTATVPTATAPAAPAEAAPPSTPSAAPSPATPAPDPASAAPPAASPAPPAEPRKAVADEKVAGAPVARAAASGGVTIQDFAFSPATITVDAGDTVSWSNRDGVQHSATADDGSFDTGLLRRGQSGSHTFTEAGTFAYHCTPHPNMTATVVVRAASTTSSGTSGDPAATTPTTTTTSTAGSLPATGLQVALIALGGVALLSAGALLRRRVED
jgi:LPXTG-motif cell wall-anchored protein